MGVRCLTHQFKMPRAEQAKRAAPYTTYVECQARSNDADRAVSFNE